MVAKTVSRKRVVTKIRKQRRVVTDPRAKDRRMVAAFTYPGAGTRYSHWFSDVRSLYRWITSWVYICTDRNATIVSQHQIRLGRLRAAEGSLKRLSAPFSKTVRMTLKSSLGLRLLRDSEEILNHPFLRLMRNPNPLVDYAGLMWLTVCYLQNTGNAYWHITLDDDGMPCELWPLPAQFVYPILGENTVFDKYEMRIGSKFQVFPAQEIIHFKRPSPLDTLSGFGNLRGVLEAAETNVRMLEFQRALFDNMAMPDFLMSPKEDTGATQLQELKESWEENYQGWLKRGQMAAVPFPVDVEQLTSRNDELQFNEGKLLIRDEIAAGYGIPTPVITMSDTTFTNAGAGMVLYARNTILPLQNHIAGRINKDLMPYFSPREEELGFYTEEEESPFFCFFDNPVPEDVVATTERLKNLVGAGIFSPNRALAELGEEPVSWGDEPWMNAGLRQPKLIVREVDALGDKAVSDLAGAIAKLEAVGDFEVANMLRTVLAELVGQPVPTTLTETPKPQQQDRPFGNGDEQKETKTVFEFNGLTIKTSQEEASSGEIVPDTGETVSDAAVEVK